tara:strand:+ start:5120 stop:5866 length:747 start_codon:yes stop_codon:yes gene_type:complete
MYFPNSKRPIPASCGLPKTKEVFLTTDDGLNLLAWYQPAKNKNSSTLIYFHGNAGDIGMRAKKIKPYIETGLGVLLTSWRGFSKNPGKPCESGLYSDGRAAIDFLLQKGISEDRIILYGESLGTGVAVELASKPYFSPAAVILEAPFTSAVDIASWRFPLIPVRHLVFDRFLSNKKIFKIGSPVLIFHGYLDKTIPITFGQQLFNLGKTPKTSFFIKNAGHNDLYEHGALNQIMEFLGKNNLISKSGK